MLPQEKHRAPSQEKDAVTIGNTAPAACCHKKNIAPAPKKKMHFGFWWLLSFLVGCWWLSLVVLGCRWLPLVAIGCYWLLFVVVRCCSLLLAVVGCCWSLLVILGYCCVLPGQIVYKVRGNATSLVIECNVAIVVSRARFPADAIFTTYFD